MASAVDEEAEVNAFMSCWKLSEREIKGQFLFKVMAKSSLL